MDNHKIPTTAIERFAKAPAPTTVAAAKSLHENIRSILGSGFETFLQGSYRNDTGVADINDVDIVALRQNTISTVFNPGAPIRNTITWDQIFGEVYSILDNSHEYKGKVRKADKCVTITTNFRADVVPAVKISEDGNDPISIYSFGEGKERRNFPRIHYERNVQKQAATKDSYKPTVRIFKRWARNWFGKTKVAPSFYIECLVYNIPDTLFHPDGAWSFYFVAHEIVNKVSALSGILSVAGDKNILAASEWDLSRFTQFQQQLAIALELTIKALTATNETDARRYWNEAFNE